MSPILFGPLDATMHSDAKPLTDAQRRKLCKMMYYAFIELRMLGREGKAERAADLASAFHNLPTGIWRDDFSLQFFRDFFVGAYQRKYPGSGNYVAMVDEIIGMED